MDDWRPITVKIRSYRYVLFCFLAAAVALAALTNGYSGPGLPWWALILPAALLLAGLLFVWSRCVDRPTEEFLTTINRAINGDYRARFSCSPENVSFGRLSVAFNQFMSCVESQTEELMENRHLQNQLYENEKVYRSALELTCERVFEADLTHNRMIYGLSIYKRTFPYLKTEMFDDIIRLISRNSVCEEDAGKYYATFSRNALAASFRKPDSAEVGLEYRQKGPNGDVFWVSATVIHLNDVPGESLKVIGYVKNVNERKIRDLELLKQSQKDGLSGLYNKQVTQSLIEGYLSGEGAGGRHAVVMIDIDNFKRINDTLGHMRGDEALVEVSRRIQEFFRSTDIAGRIGGDEFLVLLKNYASSDMLVRKMEALGDLLRDVPLKGGDRGFSGSVGVSLYPEDGTTYEELFKKADISLYYSKAHGKDRFYLYGGRFGERYGAGEPAGPDPEAGYVPREKPIESGGEEADR
jgi:diguanylate cyclase (GGDEF)-like protein